MTTICHPAVTGIGKRSNCKSSARPAAPIAVCISVTALMLTEPTENSEHSLIAIPVEPLNIAQLRPVASLTPHLCASSTPLLSGSVACPNGACDRRQSALQYSCSCSSRSSSCSTLAWSRSRRSFSHMCTLALVSTLGRAAFGREHRSMAHPDGFH